jgi:hypothetical protein
MDTDLETKLATEALSGLKQDIGAIIQEECTRLDILQAYGLLANSQRMKEIHRNIIRIYRPYRLELEGKYRVRSSIVVIR